MTGTLLRTFQTAVPDAELLGRFVAVRDEAAFTELVRRHGPVVFRVCRRVVGPSAADDAFQATFLVLATRAEKVRKAASVGSWLVGVAGRVARQMRRREVRQGGSLSPRVTDSDSCSRREQPTLNDLAGVLDDELTRLPDALRAAVVACLVQHRTHKQAAAELGESERTLRRRLDEAKKLLRLRLERRGVVPAVAAALAGGVGEASANVPAGLGERAVNLVFDFLAGGAAVASAPAVIAKGVSMTATTRTAKAVLVLAAIGMTAVGVGLAGEKPKAETIPPVDRRQPEKLKVPPDGDWVVTVHPAKAETKNFVVTAPDAVTARAVAAEAEHQRKAAAEKWLGKELPVWDKPCPIQVMTDATNGHSTFTYDSATDPPKLKSAEMVLAGTLETVLRIQLPHEVTHAVLASHFGRPLPRWADEGIALTAESIQEQAAHDAKVREFINLGRGIPLRHLLKMTEYPKDVPVLYAQGHSLVRFLLTKFERGKWIHKGEKVTTPEQAVVMFLGTGLHKDGGWESAVKLFGFESSDDMQEAWIEWLRKADSSLADALPAEKPKPTAVRQADDTLIPPMKVWR
jgi:RNA polymerase sigma factor (sigma-70 family)